MRASALVPAILFVLCSLAACNGGSSGGGPAPTPSPSPLRLYVSDGGTPGSVAAYLLPLTAKSVPIVTLTGGGVPVGMAADSAGRLFVANSATGRIQVFTQPILNGATPFFTLGPLVGTLAGDVKVDAQGNVYAPIATSCGFPCTNVQVEVFSSPVSSSSSASVTFTVQSADFIASHGMTFDPGGHLWTNTGKIPCSMREFSTPFTAASTPLLAFTNACAGYGLAFDSSGKLYTSGNGGIDVYSPPFSSSSTKDFTISSAPPSYLAFDAAGNLYAVAGSNLLEFSPPFGSTSVPVVTISLSARTQAGIAIGP